ncbi:MAG: DUF4912 domain-containing protein [Nitrospirae bacterium]|nr:DUF4912 domain-containing protein [Nitrospirota bacterium]
MSKEPLTKKTLEAMTMVQLRALARERKVPLKKGLRKAEMIALLLKPPREEAKPARTRKAPAKQPSRARAPRAAAAKAAEALPTPSPFPPMPTELPEAYGRDTLTLLVRDPWWLFAYWEIPDGRLLEGWGQLGVSAEEADLILRLSDVSNILYDGTNAHWSADFPVYHRVGRWHLEANRPGATFLAELGVKARDGRFLPLLRSNTVLAPRVGESPRLAAQWIRRRGREVTEIAPPASVKGPAVQPAARPAVSPEALAEVGGPTSPPYR